MRIVASRAYRRTPAGEVSNRLVEAARPAADLRTAAEPANASHDAQRDPPLLLTPSEVAALLRTTRGAVYAMTARAELPGVTRIGTRLLFRRAVLLRWLDQKCAPSRQRR